MVRLLSIIWILFYAPVQNFPTAAMLQSSGGHLGKGKCIQTKGRFEKGDGGDAMYKIAEGTANGFDKLAISGSSYVAELVVKKNKVDAIAFGLKKDVQVFSDFDLSSSGVVTASSSIFSSADVGKKIYLRSSFDMRPKYEAYPGYLGSVANFASLPASPNNHDLYKVLDASDDLARGLSGEQYYFYYASQGRWIWLSSFQAGIYNIIGFISATQVQIDFSPTSNLSSLSGYYGTDNRAAWETLLPYALSNNYQIYFDSGSGFLVHTDIDNPFPALDSNVDVNWGMYGAGKASKLYLTFPPDTGVVNTNLLDPINNLGLDRFVNLRFSSPVKNDFILKDLSIVGIDDVGFRRTDSWGVGFAYLQGCTGEATFDNVSFLGGAGITYVNGGTGGYTTTFQDVEIDGLENATEVAFQNFGPENDKLHIFDSDIKNLGDTRDFSFNGKARGISGYIRPWKSVKVARTNFINVKDRWQFYNGGGTDYLYDNKTSYQTFEDCNFIADGTTCLVGIWSSRVYPGMKIDNCHFYGQNGGVYEFGIQIRNSATIENSHFGPGVKGALITHSNNNVYRNPTDITVDKCYFYSGRIDLYPNSAPVSPTNIIVQNSFFYNQDTAAGEKIKVLPGDNEMKAIFQNCQFKDTAFVNIPILFFEPGAKGDIYFESCDFEFRDTLGNCQVVKQLRGESKVNFDNCTSPFNVNFQIDPYTGENYSKLRGINNKFPSRSISDASGFGQDFECFEKGKASATTNGNGEITINLTSACDLNWAKVEVTGNNDYKASVITINRSSLIVRIKDSSGIDVISTAVNLNYQIDKV